MRLFFSKSAIHPFSGTIFGKIKPKFLFRFARIFILLMVIQPLELRCDWQSLFDGKSLEGWEASEHPDSWVVEDSAIVAMGGRSHLFYTGALQPFHNFVLQVDVYTEPWSNGGIYFLTKYQSSGWPEQGFEAQVNNTALDWKKTGSLYGIKNILFFSPASDRQWWRQEIRVEDNHITISINEKIVVDYVLRDQLRPDSGTIALQSHDRRSVVKYKNIRIQPLE